MTQSNTDPRVVAGFGDEWRRLDQSRLESGDREVLADAYLRLLPWGDLRDDAEGVDVGCGSGRWALVVAPRVGHLHCVDASAEALAVAARALDGVPNVTLHCASLDNMPLADESLDFAYSLGVLHHVPRTADAIATIARKLKEGAPFLLYLYYALDNRPAWYRLLWRASEVPRWVVSRLPYGLRYIVSQLIAAVVYWPLARLARVVELAGGRVDNWPLAAYRQRGFYVMRTDALDRFGTRLEQRFSRTDIAAMMQAAGLERITFSEQVPFWCAVGYRPSRHGDAAAVLHRHA